MSKLPSQTVLSGLLHLGMARVAVVCMNLISTSRLAHTLGTESFGLYSFAISYVAYFMILVNLGFEAYLTREIAQDSTHMRPLVDKVVTMRLMLAAASSVLLIASAWVFDLPPAGRTVLMIQSINLFCAAIGLTFVYQGLQQIRVVAIREVIAAMMLMIGILLVVRGPGDIVLAIWAQTLSIVLTNVPILAQYARDFGLPRLRMPTRDDLRFVRTSMTYFWSILMIAITYNAHIVLIGLLRSDTETGLFSAGWKLFNFAVILPNLIGTVFLPRIANLTEQPAERGKTTDVYMRTIVIVAVPATIIGAAMIPQIITVLFGAAFLPASTATLLLLLNGLVVSVNIGLGTPLVAVGRQKSFLRVVGFGAAAGVVLNLVLIPLWGIEGAAFGTLIDEMVIMGMLMADRPEVSIAMLLDFGGRCMLAVFPAALAAHYIPDLPFLEWSPFAGLVVGGGVGLVIYLLALLLLRIQPISVAAGLRRLQ